MSVSEKVLDAIELLTSNSIKKAGYDRTIQAQILSCQDATIGKYKCRYQDAIIYAYTNSLDVTYTKGAYVYILVPGNDMNKEKTILGTTKKLGINYISSIQNENIYNITGAKEYLHGPYYLGKDAEGSIIGLNDTYRKKIYEYQENDKININLNQYLKDSSFFIAGARFKTSIPPIQQFRGHYGIAFNLAFLDNNTNEEVIRTYIIDQDVMEGHPYRFNRPVRQYQIFEIDGANYLRLDSIEIFNQDFPIYSGEDKGFIEITQIQLSGANRMTEKEISGIGISFQTPQGTYFSEDATEEDYKTIIAQLKVKGKLVSSTQNISFYWGIEDVGVSSKSDYYNNYLGRGWKCLNGRNVIQSATQDEPAVVEWSPGKDTYILSFKQARSKDNKIKVAAIYDENVITKEINIQNLVSEYNLTIESDSGTKFYFDIGHPILTCKINGQIAEDCSYEWAYESNNGVLQKINQTDVAEKIKDYQIKVKISKITSFGIFKCSVYKEEKYLGTAAITLTNSLESEGTYSLVINNGSTAYQYNENGIAPNSKNLIVQQQIKPLSFTIYNNVGQAIDSESMQDCLVRWEFPIEETLLVDQEEKNGQSAGIDDSGKYKYYDNKNILFYNIAPVYNVRRQRNQIKLTVNYKGMSLTAETRFTFAKQGEPGTNGTQYLVKIIPNTKMSNPPQFPMVTKSPNSEYGYKINFGVNNSEIEYNLDPNEYYSLFKAQLWRNGELVWQGQTKEKTDKTISSITWEILQSTNKNSAFEVGADSGKIRINEFQLKDNPTLVNIIKCSITLQDKIYYGTLPVAIAEVIDNKYEISLKEYTGFRYVIYSSDGTSPQYDNSQPFEFICTEGGEDISSPLKYKVSSSNNLLKILEKNDYQGNQWRARPAQKYDGLCVDTSLICQVKTANQISIGKLMIPIHFLLNKYGFAHLNEWDGNSIKINNDDGYILSPQIGAGRKNSDNTFTGLLMGEVGYSNGTKEVGLFAYNSGDRTIFLDSQTGKAEFGRAGNGQIIIDPSQNTAQIKSGNYIEGKSGLIIDLTEPFIKYGNGKFSVDKNGSLTASSGKIGGWTIGDVQLTGGKITLDSSGKIYSNEHNSLDKTGNGFYLAQDGLSIGNNFSVDKQGILNAKSGKIGGWTIGSSELSAGNLKLKSSGSIEAGDLYLRSNGSIGGENWSIDQYGNAIFNKVKTLVIESNNPANRASLVFSNGGDITGGYISGNGMTLGSGVSYLNPQAVYLPGSTTSLNQHFNSIVTNTLDVTVQANINELRANIASANYLRTNQLASAISNLSSVRIGNLDILHGIRFEAGEGKFIDKYPKWVYVSTVNDLVGKYVLTGT